MLTGDAETHGTADGRPSDEGRDQFDPSISGADELFVVLDTSLLTAVLDVFEPIDTNAQLRSEAGEGICLKTRTDHSYYVELHIRTGELTAFQPDGLNRPLSVEALATAVSETTAERVAIHGQSGEGVVLRDGDEVYDIGTSRTPLGSGHTPTMRADKAASELSFTVDASRFQPLDEVNSTREYVRIAADADADTVDVGLCSGDGEDTDSVVTVADDEFVMAPTCNLWVENAAVERLVTRGAFEAAMGPTRGAVMFGLATGSGVNFAYERADGGVTVWAKLGKTETATLA